MRRVGFPVVEISCWDYARGCDGQGRSSGPSFLAAEQLLDRIVILDERRLDHDIAEVLLNIDALPEHVLSDAVVMGHAAGDELEQIVEAAAD